MKGGPPASTGGRGPDLGTAFDLAPVAMAILDREGRVARANAAMASLCGTTAGELAHSDLRQAMPGLARDPAWNSMNEPFRTGRPAIGLLVLGVGGDVERAESEGVPRPMWIVDAALLAGEAGKADHLLLCVRALTPEGDKGRDLDATDTLLRASQELSLDGVTIVKAIRDENGAIVDFVWEYANPTAERMARAGPLVGRSMLHLLPSVGTHPLLFARYVRLLESGKGDVAEGYYEGPNTQGWFRSAAVPIGGDRLSLSWRDITDRKEAERELRTISQEYRHRIKNVLAIVSSLVAHARRTAPDAGELANVIQRQIEALGAAQDLIGTRSGGHIDLVELIQRALRPFRDSGIKVEGDAHIQIGQRHVVPIVLALNELATNACKHGALSDREGTVAVSGGCEDQRVCIHWNERRPPLARKPAEEQARQGFGTRLMRLVERSLPMGRIESNLAPDGLTATISFGGEGNPCEGDGPGGN